MRRGFVLFVFLFLCFCARPAISRDEWLKMSPSEKHVVVESLKGGETAKERKGGVRKPHDAPTDSYVQRIDAAYAAGERSTVTEIWNRM